MCSNKYNPSSDSSAWFSTDDKMLKRAGLDYWKYANVVYHDSLDELFEAHPKGQFSISQNLAKSRIQHLITLSWMKTISLCLEETSGLPKDLIEQNMDRCLRLPMTEHVRSLNLSNTAAILVYEALRQQQYRDLI